MIINRGNVAGIEYLEGRPEPILFITEGGAYYYVEQGIVENELRVMGNWKTAARPLAGKLWSVIYSQGTEIPQELGDYLVANQDLAEKVLTIKKGDVRTPRFDPEFKGICMKFNILDPETAYIYGFESAIFECGEILSRPLLAYQHNDKAPDKTEQTDNQGDD